MLFQWFYDTICGAKTDMCPVSFILALAGIFFVSREFYMKKNTFIADGQTNTFYFTFPFFLKSDVVIEVDSAPATNYNLIPLKNDSDADIPFIGGEVHFAKPPKTPSVITIQRKLPVKRIVDYQITEPYSPAAHNQDMNYIIEILKDMQDAVDSVLPLPTEAANKAAIEQLSLQIKQIGITINEIKAEIEQGGASVDLSQIYSSITNLESEINTLNSRISGLNTKIENVNTLLDTADYVIESQVPTEENNYTWYRKYASGWIEQGGRATSQDVTFPIPMANTNYACIINTLYNSTSTAIYSDLGYIVSQQTTGFTKGGNATKFQWVVYGEYAK